MRDLGTARRTRYVALALGVSLALSLIPLFAAAQLNGSNDPNDVDGLMDIRRIEVSGADRPRFLTTTFQRWRARRVWDRGFVLVYLDARGDEWFEHYALIYSTGGRMEADLYRHRRKKHDYIVKSLSSWKPTKKSVIVKIPLRHLGIPEKRTVVRWYVKSLMTGRDCPRVCIDRAPDGGSLQFPLPVPSPSPTIPSPSPSPTTPSPEPSPSPSP